MKLLAFSDLHRDLDAAASLVERSSDADLVVAAGDFASIHEGLEETIDALRAIETTTVLVPGNNETEAALREACSEWPQAVVLHGAGGGAGSLSNGGSGLMYFGLGAGIPTTPWDWSFDLSEEEAAERLANARRESTCWCSTPRPTATATTSGQGDHLGSRAILEAIEHKQPQGRGLRAHPRVLGRREHDRRDARLQPRARRAEIEAA